MNPSITHGINFGRMGTSLSTVQRHARMPWISYTNLNCTCACCSRLHLLHAMTDSPLSSSSFMSESSLDLTLQAKHAESKENSAQELRSARFSCHVACHHAFQIVFRRHMLEQAHSASSSPSISWVSNDDLLSRLRLLLRGTASLTSISFLSQSKFPKLNYIQNV